MSKLLHVIIMLLILQLGPPLMAGGTGVRVVKKPEGLRFESPDPFHPNLTAQDRMKWKSVLNWCDECDEKAKPFTQSFDGEYGHIFIYPIGDDQYIVDIDCEISMQQSEHFYYKVRDRDDTIESRLLVLEQYYFIPAEGSSTGGIEEPEHDPEGEFVKFSDSLVWGATHIPDKNAPLVIIERRYRLSGGCGLYAVYDVSGDCPKEIEFRAKLFCSTESPMPEEWILYPAEQRAKWRVVPNPQRDGWKASATPACSK